MSSTFSRKSFFVFPSKSLLLLGFLTYASGLTFYARDASSNVSAGMQTRVLKTDTDTYAILNPTEPDIYEADPEDPYRPGDNDPAYATYSDLPLIQVHTLHESNDCDWVRFYASEDLVYDIETVHLDTNSAIDTAITFISRNPMGR